MPNSKAYIIDPKSCAPCRQHFAPEVASQVAELLHFVDFLREPQVDPDTGEPLDVQKKTYEALAGGLPEMRSVFCCADLRFFLCRTYFLDASVELND